MTRNAMDDAEPASEPEPEAAEAEPIAEPEPAPVDPDGLQAVLEGTDGSRVLAGMPHNRQRVLTISGHPWLHKSDDIDGRWVYRKD